MQVHLNIFSEIQNLCAQIVQVTNILVDHANKCITIILSGASHKIGSSRAHFLSMKVMKLIMNFSKEKCTIQ